MGKMTSQALDAIREESFKMLDTVARYTKECEVMEAVLPSYLTHKEHETYWSLNTKWGQTQGIFIAHHLGETETLADLAGVLTAITAVGWMPDKTEDFMDGYGKSYPFHQTITIGGTEHRLTLTMRVFPHPNSQTCKKVQIGTEPKYELQCIGEKI